MYIFGSCRFGCWRAGGGSERVFRSIISSFGILSFEMDLESCSYDVTCCYATRLPSDFYRGCTMLVLCRWPTCIPKLPAELI
jgi:hypothetical protein